ncbi:MAG: hypothetical protein ACREGA_03000 [Candidatus Saccharimonadales bacterium]
MDDYYGRPTNKKIKVLAALVILAVIVLALLAIFGHKHKTISHNQKTNPAEHTVSQKFAVPPSLAQAINYDQNSLLISNGRSFVVYNYISGKTQLLSPDSTNNYLSGIDSLSISTDKQYLVFHQTTAVSGGALYNILQQNGLDSSSPFGYWWLYSVKNQNFRPLDQTILQAKIGGQTIYGLAAGNGGETITAYSPAGLQKILTTNVPGSSNFFPLQKGFLLQSPDGKALLNSGGAVNQTLAQNTTVVGVLPSQMLAVGVVKNQTNRQLETINLKTDSTKIIAGNIQNSPAWLQSGAVIYITSSKTGQPPTFYQYNLASGQSVQLNFSQALGNTAAASLNPIAMVGQATAVVQNTSNNYYLIGNQLAKIKPPANYSSNVSVAGQSLNLSYSPPQNAFVIAGINGSASAELKAVNHQLLQAGYNPYLFTIDFSTSSE